MAHASAKFGGKLSNVTGETRREREKDEPTKVVNVKEREANEPAPAEVFDKNVQFPRRALLISVHNYLFANPVGAGLPTRGARTVAGLPDKLSNGLRIPRNQIAHLSDVANRGQSRPPLRPIISP